MRYLVNSAAILAVACWMVNAAHAAPRAVVDCFEGVLSPQESWTDTQIDPVGWSGDCSAACCGDSCSDAGCCGSTVSGCGAACGCACSPCSLDNCGLLGQGYLTYDACAEGCVLPEMLLGCFACPTEGCFDEFISPMTNPAYFEDPRNVSELRAIFLQHKVPLTAGGGDIQLYALQVRAKLTDRLSLIATRDGYAVSTNPLIDDGWADVDVGLKYALMRDAANQRLLSAGVTYTLPVGSQRTLQDRGDGVFNLFLTGGTEILGCGHWVSAFGGLLPVDQDANSSFVYWSNHFDYQVRRGWYAVTEFNWFHYAQDGAGQLGLPIDGGDLFNLGSAGIEGQNIVTGAIGMKYKPNKKTEVGVAWEVPLTDRRYVLDNRLTVDLILRY
ncbi:hypothetical protein [Botrimarina hoheduenensis]|uniref:Uncharacterized protein n=1 Tax=Botrimarina hoheduenensis TaxID=2528000 RepID=A0A5C5VQ97_9BACT|nr:hypothetical protein [Botrimarina hoheduenensis]TWT40764.1 hypothetical protein Pla111_31820 [Botrimarina hoheduenensis]